jgi:Skp family chaperone for outer membrane proteins
MAKPAPPTKRELTPDRSSVVITEAPKAEQVVHDLEAIRAAIKQLERQLEGRNNRRRANEGRNRSRQQDAQRDKSIALKIAADLMQEDRTLQHRRKTSELARRIRRRWPSRKPPSIRTLCRYLTGK